MKIRVIQSITTLLFIGLAFFSSNKVLAQNYIEDIEASDFTIKLNPATPGTNEQVTATVSSLIVSADRLRITWLIDGKVVKSGLGETTITFTTGEQGSLTNLETFVQVDNTSTIRKWNRISPADLDILWQADTYTPPFYRGKALPTPESFIRVVGMPNVRNEGAQKLENGMVFVWEHNGKRQPNDSGFGQNPFVYRNDFLDLEDQITLEVIHEDGLTRAKQSIFVPISNPEVVVYEDSSFLRKAFGKGEPAASGRLVFTAEPYYFSTKRELLNTLNYRWIMNGTTILEQTSPRKNELIATAPRGGVVTEIGIQVNHPSKPLQGSPVRNFTVVQ